MCKGLATLPATCLKGAKDIKHKISFLLQKPEPPAAHQAAAARRVPNRAEVEKWKESFNHVINSDIGRAVFTTFLKSEFSEENIDFWTACQEYKKTAPSKMSSRAKQIYQQYVKADAPNEVNLDGETREETRQNVENPCPSCFDKAQKTIYTLMEKDSYRRFLKSELMRDLCQKHASDTQQSKEKKSSHCADNRKVLTGGA